MAPGNNHVTAILSENFKYVRIQPNFARRAIQLGWPHQHPVALQYWLSNWKFIGLMDCCEKNDCWGFKHEPQVTQTHCSFRVWELVTYMSTGPSLSLDWQFSNLTQVNSKYVFFFFHLVTTHCYLCLRQYNVWQHLSSFSYPCHGDMV